MDLLNCIEKFYSPAPKPASGVRPKPAIPADLEFPISELADWPQTLIGPEAMLRRCEMNLPFRNAAPDSALKRLAGKCTVEFVMR